MSQNRLENRGFCRFAEKMQGDESSFLFSDKTYPCGETGASENMKLLFSGWVVAMKLLFEGLWIGNCCQPVVIF